MPCWEGEPNVRQFFAEIFIKRRFFSKKLCLLCCILSVYRLQNMICHLSSLGSDFHIPVDFGSNVLFPHIFSVLHCNSIETSWFSLVIHGSPLTEEKSMPSSLDTRISMLSPPVSRRAHLRSQKKTYTQIKAFEFFAFRCILTGPRGCAEAMGFSSIRPVRSDGVVRSLTHHFHQALGTGCMTWRSSRFSSCAEPSGGPGGPQ